MSCLHHEDAVDGVQYDQNHFGVFDLQQVENRLQSATLHQLDHLLNSAPAGEVGYCPHSLPLSLEVSLQTVTGEETIQYLQLMFLR